MSTITIFWFALGVFTLMITGILLTMREFYKLTDDPSIRKGVGSGQSIDSNSEDTA